MYECSSISEFRLLNSSLSGAVLHLICIISLNVAQSAKKVEFEL